jgi:hypothetical protein
MYVCIICTHIHTFIKVLIQREGTLPLLSDASLFTPEPPSAVPDWAETVEQYLPAELLAGELGGGEGSPEVWAAEMLGQVEVRDSLYVYKSTFQLARGLGC